MADKITRGDMRMGIRAITHGWPVTDAKLNELHSGAIELALVGTDRERTTAREFIDALEKSGRTAVIARDNEQTKKTVTLTEASVATRGSRSEDPSNSTYTSRQRH